MKIIFLLFLRALVFVFFWRHRGAIDNVPAQSSLNQRTIGASVALHDSSPLTNKQSTNRAPAAATPQPAWQAAPWPALCGYHCCACALSARWVYSVCIMYAFSAQSCTGHSHRRGGSSGRGLCTGEGQSDSVLGPSFLVF